MEDEIINPFVIFQMVNLCNKITRRVYDVQEYRFLKDESKEVVNGFVRNLLLYNHYANSDTNWNHNPMKYSSEEQD